MSNGIVFSVLVYASATLGSRSHFQHSPIAAPAAANGGAGTPTYEFHHPIVVVVVIVIDILQRVNNGNRPNTVCDTITNENI